MKGTQLTLWISFFVAAFGMDTSAQLINEASDLDYDRIHFIDVAYPFSNETQYNLLFRGNEPINSTDQFAYDELISWLQSKAQEEANLDLPSQFLLVDINFLNLSEEKDLQTEKRWFEANPSLGSFIHWPIIGQVLPPEDVPERERKKMAETLSSWDYDDLPNKMIDIRKILYDNSSLPLVVYWHCEAGEDRTGEMSGAYYMKWLNYTFQTALDIDNHIEDREIHTASRNAMQWYCYYLQYVEGTQSDCTIPDSK